MTERSADIPPGVPTDDVRRCHVCRTPVAYFLPLPNKGPIHERKLVRLPTAGKSKHRYVCTEHEDEHAPPT